MQKFEKSWGFRAASLAAVVTMLASASPTLLAFEVWSLSNGLYAAMLVALLSLFWGTYRLKGTEKATAARVLVSLQIFAFLVMEMTSRRYDTTWLCAMPLLGQMLFVFPRKTGILIILALFGVVCAFFARDASGVDLLWRIGVSAGSFAFVTGFALATQQADAGRLESERLAGELAEANRKLLAQAETIEALTREQERARVARELHDSLGHTLTSLSLQLEIAHEVRDRNDARVGAALGRARTLVGLAMGDVRNSVSRLRTSSAPRPLFERISSLAENEDESGVVVTFQLAGNSCSLSSDTDLALFRTAQEGLTNVRRHSRATKAWVTLDYSSPARVRLEVADNGLGGDALSNGGFGLKGLRERLDLLGGTLETGRSGQGGYSLTVEVPR